MRYAVMEIFVLTFRGFQSSSKSDQNEIFIAAEYKIILL